MKLENELRLKNIEFEKARASIVILRQQLELAQKAETTVSILQEKLESAKAELLKTFEKVKEDQVKVSDRMNFLEESVKTSGEETLSMERKMVVSIKNAKIKETENLTLNQKFDVL